MSQDTSTTTPTGGTETTETEAPEWTPPASQQELDRIIGDRLARQRAQYAGFDEYRQKAARFDEIEEASKSEIQRATEARQAAEERATAAARELIRYKVAAETGVPAQMLVGDDEEAMTAHAAELIAWRGAQEPQAPPAGPSFDVGPRNAPPATADMNDLIRRRLRGA